MKKNIYIYICVVYKLVNNAEWTSQLKGILCSVRMEQRRTRMSNPPFCNTALNEAYTLCKAEVSLINPYRFRFHLPKSVFFGCKTIGWLCF
jgi:hypothetical protein